MAISPEAQQHQPNNVLSNGNKSLTRQRRRNNNNNNNHDDPAHASDASYSSDSSSGSSNKSASKQQQQRPTGQRRQRNRKNNRGRNNSKQKKHQATTLSQELPKYMYVALDCEMVGVGVDGLVSELARVTIVGWDGHVILDEYVQPTSPVTDYRTFVSGITPEDLQDDKVIDIETCRVKVQEILEGRILVGHALKNDLVALGIRHPWFMTRDTAKYEPFMKVREYDGMVLPRKLKDLTCQYLKRDIQLPGRPHCPREDAVAAMDLYKTVRGKWESIMEYKINKTRQIEMQQQQQYHQQHQQQFYAAVPAY